MLEEIAILTLFHFFLIFCRLGAAFMLFPGFGEVYVTARARLITALSISSLMTPILAPLLPAEVPSDSTIMILMIFSEILVGLFIGFITRMIQAVLHIAGMIIAFQSGLASAMLFDSTQGSQGSIFGSFMTVVGLTLIFVTDLHHLMIAGISESYNMFGAAIMPPVEDFAGFAVQTLSKGFVVAFQISSPLIIVGLLIYLSSGIMGRLMPQMQAFFVIMPLQIYISFAILAIILSAGMMRYLEFFKETLEYLFTG